MVNAFIIVWRESLEALLIIGVLQAWIAQQSGAAALRRSLWLGVAAGVALAVALGVATLSVGALLDGIAFDLFHSAMALGAAALIVHMLWWMRRHAASLRGALQARAQDTSGAWGLAGVATLAVAREGSETVLFLMGAGGAGPGSLPVLGAAGAGLATAVLTTGLISRGSRRLDARTVFRVAEALLLLVASAMLAQAVERLIAIDWLFTGPDPLWDLSAWLPDAQGPGRLLADFAGYRARPSATQLAAALLFWSTALAALRHATARRAAR
jgi:high-affinity iron transporter